jgi:hypothetical protein
MGRYKSKNPTVSIGFSIKPDVRQMMENQADDAGLTMSAYLERLILEKHFTAKAHSEDSLNSN